MNKKTKLFLLLGVVALVGIGIFIYSQKPVLPPSLLEPEEEESVAPTEEIVLPTDEEIEEIKEAREEITVERGPGLSSCIVLAEEYCQRGEVHEREQVYQDLGIRKIFKDLLFSLSAGAKVYSPVKGSVLGGESFNPQEGWSQNYVEVLVPPEENGTSFWFNGVKFDSALEQEFQRTKGRVEVKVGQLLGVVDGETVKGSDIPHGFTLHITVIKGNFKLASEAAGKNDFETMVKATEPDNATLGKFFPYYLE